MEAIEWLGHAAFKIRDFEKGVIIYIDPFKLKETEKADIILITHSHYDHCSIDDIKKIQKEDTIIVAPEDCKNLNSKVRIIKPNEKLEIKGVPIETVPAYNINKEFHPRKNNWVGYILTVNGKKIYHSGDTDAIPEMGSLKVDVALLPVGGTYTMNAEEAANIVNKFKPGIAVPMHWGTIIGNIDNANKFINLCSKKGINAKILEML